VVISVEVASISPDGTNASRIQCATRRRAQRHQQPDQDIAAAPHHALPVQSKPGLDEQRIGQQPGKAAEVRRGIERIRIVAVPRQAEPALQQRCLRRDREEQRPDRQTEQPRHPDRGLRGRARLERGEPDRQPQPRDEQDAEMRHRLRAWVHPTEPVRIAVPGEQQRLIDEHRRIPHRRRAAKPRQRHPRDHRLDEEEQERARQDRQHEQRPGKAHGSSEGRHVVGRSIR
jgi:hypothetical protein